MRGLVCLAVIGLVLGTLGCGSTATVSSVVSSRYYTVNAPLMVTRSQPVTACNGILLSLPPAGCGGVEVANVNPAAIPGTTHYGNGTLLTPTMRLVGLWDGKRLTLVEVSPTPEGVNGTEPTPVSEPPPPPPIASAQEINDRILHDMPELRAGGIVVLSFGVGADGVEVLIAVPDPDSVATMYQRYGHIHISGWLQPVS